MINDFDIKIATKFVFGRGVEKKVGNELAEIGASTVLLHYDGGDYLSKSGVLDIVRTSLNEAGLDICELGGVQPNPRLSLVCKGIALCREKGVDAIVALGGGSTIDSAKAIGLGAADEMGGDVWDYFTGVREPKSTVPVAAIVTCPASGSESSQVVVVNNDIEHAKLLVSLPVVRPAIAIMDPELSLSLPAGPTACGLVDMFCHVAERYFTDDDDFGILDRMSEGAMRSIVELGPRLMANLHSYEFRSEAMWAATVAQNNSLGMGRNQDWSTHALSNELSAVYDMPHGKTISALMCSWMRYVCAANPARFRRFAEKVFCIRPEGRDDLDIANEGIDACEAWFQELGMPVSLAETGVDAEGISRMLDAVEFYGADSAIGSVKRLRRDDCAAIFRMACEPRG